MCGIAGFSGPFSREVLVGMTDAIIHRGPDEAGIEWSPGDNEQPHCGLGSRRLTIIDLHTGQQPMWSASGSSVIVHNGEIYNYRELRDELVGLGAEFRTSSDTEVILQAWETWGERLLDRLEGMFAFAIWDKAQKRWFFARDRFGIKPLYYCHPQPGTLAFCSEIRGLLPLLESPRVSQIALYHYLLYGWIGIEQCIFEGIKQLPPAHSMSWDPQRQDLSMRRYWRIRRHDFAGDWCEQIKDRFDAAVGSHLVSDVPVGVALSGGIDSSSVLASMARQGSPEEIRAFALGYDLPDDELPYARTAAEHLGVSLAEHVISPTRIADNFGRIIQSLEEPLAHPVAATTYELAAFVGSQVKVMLIGEGSDELFAGYPHHRLFGLPFRLLPRRSFRSSYMAIANVLPTAKKLTQLLTPEMLQPGLMDLAAHQFDEYFPRGRLTEGALRFELERQLTANQLLRVDKLTMASSVEARVPFLDRSFAELAFSIPMNQKRRRGVQKYILRACMADRLPRQIVNRPKSGKGGTQALLPTYLDLVRRGALADLLSRDTLAKRGWFEPDATLRYLDQADGSYVRRHPVERRRRAKFALALAALEQWARLFLDGAASAEDAD